LALGRIKLNSKSRILKVDLWNEGVETSRDILSHFEGFQTVGFDLSKCICRMANERLRGTGILQATCQTLPFAGKGFDLVLDLSTIDHIPFSKTKVIFNEYFRVLKPKGLLAIAFWQSNLATKYILQADPDQFYFDSKRVAESLEDSGFNIIESYNTGLLLTVKNCNFWLGQFMFWRLKTVFEDQLLASSAKLEPYLINWLGGLRVYYACHP
jgi:SAM-dependent methyltransferase